MDLFNPSFTVSYVRPDMTPEEAQDVIRTLVDGMHSIPYWLAVQLFSIAQWDMRGTWIPISYVGLTIEESIRRAQLKNVVYDQDLVYITAQTEWGNVLSDILSEKTQNMKIITETRENPGEI
jgi:hypothetical protein